jgi:hypothetical protein
MLNVALEKVPEESTMRRAIHQYALSVGFKPTDGCARGGADSIVSLGVVG